MTYDCSHCNEAKSEAEVIKVPRDEYDKPGFMGCRACNCRVTARLEPIE